MECARAVKGGHRSYVDVVGWLMHSRVTGVTESEGVRYVHPFHRADGTKADQADRQTWFQQARTGILGICTPASLGVGTGGQ